MIDYFCDMKSSYFFIFFLGVMIVSLAACNQVQNPTFIGIEGLKLDQISIKNTSVQANMKFNNPNSFGLTVAGTDLDIYLDDKKAGIVNQSQEIEVLAHSDFKVPIKASIDKDAITKELFSNIGKALDLALGKKLPLRMKGYVYIKVLGQKIPIPIDHSQEISI